MIYKNKQLKKAKGMLNCAHWVWESTFSKQTPILIVVNNFIFKLRDR